MIATDLRKKRTSSAHNTVNYPPSLKKFRDKIMCIEQKDSEKAQLLNTAKQNKESTSFVTNTSKTGFEASFAVSPTNADLIKTASRLLSNIENFRVPLGIDVKELAVNSTVNTVKKTIVKLLEEAHKSTSAIISLNKMIAARKLSLQLISFIPKVYKGLISEVNNNVLDCLSEIMDTLLPKLEKAPPKNKESVVTKLLTLYELGGGDIMNFGKATSDGKKDTKTTVSSPS